MTVVAGGKMQGGHVSVTLVPWEGTRYSTADWLCSLYPDFSSIRECGDVQELF